MNNVEVGYPEVGDIVHYVSFGTPGGEYGKVCRAAVITEVKRNDEEGRLSLCVLNPTGMFFNQSVPFDNGGEKGGYPDCILRGMHIGLSHCQCGWEAAQLRGGTWHYRKSSCGEASNG